MRTLALLLVMTVGAWGQSKPDSFAVELIARGTPIDISREHGAQFLVAAWDAYAKECYADSAYVIWTGWMEEPIVEVRTVREAEDFYRNWGKRGTWTHQAPTFPGFIEYLRRRR